MSRIVWLVVFAVQMILMAAAQQSTQASDPKTGDDQSLQLQGNIERATEVQGADCGPYLAKVLQSIRTNWPPLVPPEAKAPELKPGKGVIEFTIMPDGRVTGVKTVSGTGDAAMDHATSEAITMSQPFAPLPPEFHVPALTLRFRFSYNPSKDTAPEDTKKPGDAVEH
jgi:TonB family protein